MTIIQRIRRIRCWLRGYHRNTPEIGRFRYDMPGICYDCGVVGSGVEQEGE